MTPSERNRLKAKQRRLSSARANRHGPPPAGVDDWWQQIETTARELGMTITWDEWCAASAKDVEVEL
jgi:hypothetical protein